MRYFTSTIVFLFLIIIIGEAYAQNPGFNKSKDLLLANFDLKPDEDDVMAAAALASMLKHPDLSGVNTFAVAGAYGRQGGRFITIAVPGLYHQLFGAENQKWTDAHKNWSASVGRAKNKVKAALNGGGRVFVAEAGQSDFTHDVMRAAINEGIPSRTIKENVYVVQHSDWNERQANASKLNWVRNNTSYRKIADGNSNNNGTPGFNNRDQKWLNQAKSNNNRNRTARNFWIEADRVCDNFDASYKNPTIERGGVDFSDCVEVWWIFKIGNKADNIGKFWSRYVTNGNSDGGGGGNPNPTGAQRIQSVKSGKWVSPINGTGTNGAQVVNHPNKSGDARLWNFVDKGSGFVEIKNVRSGRCIAVPGGNTNNGVKLAQWDCRGYQDQQWKRLSRGNGQFSFQNRKTNKCIDLSGGNTNNNVQFQQWDCNAPNQNQRFKLLASNARYGTNTALKVLSIYPNPARDIIQIAFDNSKSETVIVLDTNGKTVLEQKPLLGTSELSLDIAHLKSGLYMIKASGDTFRFVKK